MILPPLAMALSFVSAAQAVPSERADTTPQNAPVSTIADALATLKASRDSSRGTSGPVPIATAGSWITQADYPPAALRQQHAGAVGVELAIDVQGRVTACRIAASSGFVELDQQTCMLMRQRARFSPARDTAGHAIPGTYASRARWVIPKSEPTQVANWLSIGTMRLAADSTMIDCKPEDIGPVPERVGNPCRAFRAGRPHALLGAIGGKTGQPLTLVTEIAMTFAGQPAPAMRYTAPGHRLAARSQIRFEVNEAGAVENCEKVPTGEEGFLGQLPNACTYGMGAFAPATNAAGAPVRAKGTYTVAMSVVE